MKFYTRFVSRQTELFNWYILDGALLMSLQEFEIYFLSRLAVKISWNFVFWKRRYCAQSDRYTSIFCTKLSSGQIANIIFCFNLEKSFIKTFQLIPQVHGDEFISHTILHEWNNRFNIGFEDINDHPNVVQARVLSWDRKNLHDFLNIQVNLSLCFEKMRLGTSKGSIFRLLLEHLGYQKCWAHLVEPKRIDHPNIAQNPTL